MFISTKGQYALRMMVDLAMNRDGTYVTVKTIAKRQGISEKYLEQIMGLLTKAGYLRSVRGAKGGYCLAAEPDCYTVGMVLRTVEGSLSPVDARPLEGEENVHLIDSVINGVWIKLEHAIDNIVDEITIKDLVEDYNAKVGYMYMI